MIRLAHTQSLPEMLEGYFLTTLLTRDISIEEYTSRLEAMISKGFRMLMAYDEDRLAGISGYWIGTKIYSGKYLEPDNFVVHPDYRSRGIGKRMLDELHRTAAENGCRVMMLDAYTVNADGHRFYFREGFVIRGFHFIREI